MVRQTLKILQVMCYYIPLFRPYIEIYQPDKILGIVTKFQFLANNRLIPPDNTRKFDQKICTIEQKWVKLIN